MRTRCATALCLAFLSACAEPEEPAQVKRHLSDFGEAATRCLRDTDRVRFEHSGNCIRAARLLSDGAMREHIDTICLDLQSLRCLRIHRPRLFYEQNYWRAVANSLARYGRPRLPESPVSNPISYPTNAAGEVEHTGFYLDVHLLEAAFADCLKAHPDAPVQVESAEDREKLARGEFVPPTAPPQENYDCLASWQVALRTM